ncbi:MAG: lipoyl(octanoyl) transferase LipB [Betaproteobacteria bacterium]|nr:lipoyl(octanoyl) transferase LipB [Betaproteobacteria bacterium]
MSNVQALVSDRSEPEYDGLKQPSVASHPPAPVIRHLGLVEFQPTCAAMRQFTTSRRHDTPDELWVLQHPPLYSAGLATRQRHLPRDSSIPLERTDRGGQITYHGPGQVVIYALLDLARRDLKIRALVSLLEQAVIDTLAQYHVSAQMNSAAPGVYVNGAKIAALGLRVRRGGCYHGVALNVDMDLAPFLAIDPCGYPGLAVTQTRDLGIVANVDELGDRLAANLTQHLARHERNH